MILIDDYLSEQEKYEKNMASLQLFLMQVGHFMKHMVFQMKKKKVMTQIYIDCQIL